MKLNGIIVAALSGFFAAGAALAVASPTTQPAATVMNELQLNANEDMGRGDYKSALPLLQKVSEMLADQPDQLGPVLEQIRVCRHQILNPAPNPATAAAQPSIAVVVDGGPRHIHPAPT